MAEQAFADLVDDLIHMYRDFPLPVILAGADFHVYWGNDRAGLFLPGLAGSKWLDNLLAEFDRESILEALDQRGSYTIADILPLSGMQLSILPVRSQDGLEGMVLIWMHDDNLPDSHSFYRVTKTASALTGELYGAADKMFTILELASAKADMMNASWIKDNFTALSQYCYRILRISGNVSLYSRCQSGQLYLETQPLDLCSLLEEWQQAVRLMATSMEIPVIFRLPRYMAAVRLDRQKFEAVFFNVLHNALYFTRPGNEITVWLRREGEFVTLIVRDKGAGIPRQVLSQATKPYVSYDHTGSHPTMGLGLALSKILVEAHGGSLSVSSRLGMGTAVTIRLPQSSFSDIVPLGQDSAHLYLGDRFSAVYTGLSDACISPHHIGPV